MKKPFGTVEDPDQRTDAGATHVGEDVPAPRRAEARRRIENKPGFFASLGREARNVIMQYDGPEVMGPPRRERAR
jgi:hypothetical protein